MDQKYIENSTTTNPLPTLLQTPWKPQHFCPQLPTKKQEEQTVKGKQQTFTANMQPEQATYNAAF